MNLTNKVIVVTGASDGIGKAIAMRLSCEKCSLALIGRDQERLAIVGKKCESRGALNVRTYSCDISLRETVSRTVQSIVVDFGVIDVLINNAGIWQLIQTSRD